MKSLIELVKFVGPKNLRHVSILDDKNNDTKLQKLYQSLKDGKVKEEEYLAKSLFGISSDSPVFRQLKSKLKTRLVNNLFLLEPNEAKFKSYPKAFQNCRKLFFAAEILYTMGARSISISLAEKSFRMADKFQFSDISEMSASFLRNAFRTLGNKSKLKYYREKSEIYYQKYLAEKEISFIRSNLVEDIELNKALEMVDFEYLEVQENRLLEILSDELSPSAYVSGYNALCLIKGFQQKYEEEIVFAYKAIDNLSQYSFLPSIFLLSFYDVILTSAIALNDFNAGKSVMDKSNKGLLKVKGVNRIFLSMNFMVLSFRTANYSAALDLYLNVMEKSIWKKAPPNLKESWKLFGAHLYFLYNIKLLDDPNKIFDGFRMGRFFNSIKHINKDKTGYNLSLLILQIIYFLEKKNYDLVIDYLESLNSYNYRYLRKEESARSQYFIKMLLTLSDGNFHRVAVERKSKKWKEKLNKTKVLNSKEALRSEIIPYLVLWEIILERLEYKIKNIS